MENKIQQKEKDQWSADFTSMLSLGGGTIKKLIKPLFTRLVSSGKDILTGRVTLDEKTFESTTVDVENAVEKIGILSVEVETDENGQSTVGIYLTLANREDIVIRPAGSTNPVALKCRLDTVLQGLADSAVTAIDDGAF